MKQEYIENIKKLRKIKTYLQDVNNFILDKCEEVGLDYDMTHIKIFNTSELVIQDLENLLRSLDIKEYVK